MPRPLTVLLAILSLLVLAAPAAAVTPQQRAMQVARHELRLGAAEAPLGSNDGPAIRRYRRSVQGAVAGSPWSGYFVSWVAAQVDSPLGSRGQGFGSSAQLGAWARATGRASTAPETGMIATAGSYTGIVERHSAGSVTLISGNVLNRVARVRLPLGAVALYVRL